MKSYSSKEMKRYNHLIGEINAVYHELSLKLGISDGAMAILYTICDNGESCPLMEICRRSGVSKQTINSALRKLEREGVVYLVNAGGRNKNVCLTEKGKLLAERTAVRVIKTENDIFASWPKEEVFKYLEATERFLEDISERAQRMQSGGFK